MRDAQHPTPGQDHALLGPRGTSKERTRTVTHPHARPPGLVSSMLSPDQFAPRPCLAAFTCTFPGLNFLTCTPSPPTIVHSLFLTLYACRVPGPGGAWHTSSTLSRSAAGPLTVAASSRQRHRQSGGGGWGGCSGCSNSSGERLTSVDRTAGNPIRWKHPAAGFIGNL